MGQQMLNEPRIEAVPTAAGPHNRMDRPSGKHQVANEIECLVASTLVRPPKCVFLKPVIAKNQQLGTRHMPTKTCRIQPTGLLGCHKRAGSRQFITK